MRKKRYQIEVSNLAAFCRLLPLFASFSIQQSGGVLAVHPGDELEADLLWTDRLAGTGYRAVAKPFGVHRLDHARDAPFLFVLALRKQPKMRNFGGYEKHCARILAGRHARATADAL